MKIVVLKISDEILLRFMKNNAGSMISMPAEY